MCALRLHAHGMFPLCASACDVRLRGDCVPSTGHRACQNSRVVQDDGSLGRSDNGTCEAGSREESAGVAAAVRALVCCHNFTDFGLPLLAHAVNLTRAAGNGGWF